jgi:hypothetical protein|tara:strand:+ start:985 stop:1098 length:114 start_codon:yes stop_codon:yes gene_type:complete
MTLAGLFFIGVPFSIFFMWCLLKFREYRMKERLDNEK